jgi:thiaminase
MIKVLDLRERYPRWQEVLKHPFLARLYANEVSPWLLRRWMVQNLHLSEGLMRLQAHLIRLAPPAHRAVLAQTLLTTLEELDVLAHETLDFTEDPHPSRREYLSFLEGLECIPYANASVAHWVLHRCYADAIAPLRPFDDTISILNQTYNSPEFLAVIHDLGGIAEEVWQSVPHQELDYLVEQTLMHNQASWDMLLEFWQEDQMFR